MPETKSPVSAEILQTVLTDYAAGFGVSDYLYRIAIAYPQHKEVAERFASGGGVILRDLLDAEQFFSQYPELLSDELRTALLIKSLKRV